MIEPKIGERIKAIFDARQMKLKDFAEEIGVARQNIYRIFEKDSIDTDLLIKISSVLEHNFFMYFESVDSNKKIGSGQIDKGENEALLKELDFINNELRLAKKEIDYLKKIIDLMEERTKLLLAQK